MTQEQKAKAYDEAIERAKTLQKTCDSQAVVGWCEYLFPELKEREDERIRKAIIEYLRQRLDRSPSISAAIGSWIAWLEKQEGCEHIKKEWLEHIKQSWYKEGFIDGKYSGGTSKEWTINDTTTLNELIDFLENGTAKLQHDLTRYANWLKIQFTPIEKQGEQKPADTIEPKFKVSDWIIAADDEGNITIEKIIEFLGDKVRLVDTNGHYTLWPQHELNYYRLWNIRDAMDGDVLYSKEHNLLWIYKDAEQYYSCINLNYSSNISIGGDIVIPNDTCPTTKEQRDLLFQKMKEAGYEWDSEKKGLRKIEQNTTQEIEPFEAEHGKYYYCTKDYFCGGRKQASKGDVVQALRGLPIMGLKDASEYFLPVNSIKCNSTWSEEDEENFRDIIGAIHAVAYQTTEDEEARIEWVKSIKQRMGNKL